MSDIDHEVGQRVHMIMWRGRIPQRVVASRLGISQPALSMKLRGVRPWSLDEVFTVAGALGVSAHELIPEFTPQPTDDPSSVRRQGLEPRTRWLVHRIPCVQPACGEAA